MRLSALVAGAALLGACISLDVPEPPDEPSDPALESYAPSTGVDLSKMTKLPSGIYILDAIEGTGEVLTEKRAVTLTFVGMLKNGYVFDRVVSVAPVDLRGVLTGFADGMIGMRAGGTRKTVVPSALAYGPRGAAGLGIPSNATVIYEITLVSF